MASSAPRRQGFRPRADALVLSTKTGTLPDYPAEIAPIFDPANYTKPVSRCATDTHDQVYPPSADPYAPAPVPDRPPHLADPYLRAYLASNERLRLSMLWYYTHDIFKEKEFLLGLQEKAAVAQESTGWEYVVIGLLDVHVYTRLATVGLPLGILPRGETLCAHTVTQPPGSVFLLPNMTEDWRFRQSPYVEHGGLVAYAGVPLRLQNESGQSVGLGSLCVTSSTSQEPLTRTQQSTLARLADWVVSDLVQCTRARRQRVRREMTDLLAKAQKLMDQTDSEDPVYDILAIMYPTADVALQPYKGGDVHIDGLDPIQACDIEDGIWEDVDFLDDFIAHSNHQDLPTDRIVRLLTAQCESVSGASLLSVASKNYRHVFDDIDSWFLQSCATMLTSMWQKRLLNEAMKAKERFLRGFSHQLRTPLHVILSSVELLAEEMKTQTLRELSRTTPALLQLAQAVDSESPIVYLDTIKSAGRDLINIVNSMILLSRWADIAAKERNYALHTIHDVEQELNNEISKVLSSDSRYCTTVFFHHNLRSERDSLKIDLALLRDSVLPLVVNAIQSAPDGMVVVTITISPSTKELLVDVQDTGCGILEEDRERIFEPYERIDATDTIGAGLGLSLASRFATLMHGSVELVASQKDRGSHFRASFKGVESSLSPSPLKKLASELGRLPRQFDCARESDGTHLSLCAQFSQFLSTQGFAVSEDLSDALRFFEYHPDLQKDLTPPGNIAICLVPSCHADRAPTQTCEGVVYVSAPFSTSKLRAALYEVDRMLAAAEEARKPADEGGCESATQNKELAPQTDDVDHDERVPSPSVVEPKAAILNLVEDRPQKDQNADASEETLAARKPEVATEEKTLSAINSPIRGAAVKPVALLVDDNSVNLRILQMYCNKRKISYFSAADGQQAVDIYKERQSLHASGQGEAISLVLMDLQMPVCDGIEATRQIRQLEQDKQWPRSSLFIVTGQDGPSDRAAADEVGADDYFVKPVSIKFLDAGVKQHFPDFKTS
ncbi:histidine kinase HHK3 [Microdochium trichocladiopsis]|uniref:histidine kinase n=1 Tax=Microdochium trichocladiopsis TaxID=1682393 RepID=A0A9P9BLX7_9PEZI|nr:histidine kinase HHK3 [Microdochium trichocladiopsis]KAH7025690.1 histidine kinase HHK3 [Microdochium trichocladiopsis]